MPLCTRKGCGQEFTESSTKKCIHHPGVPVFHEGLKSWSCCADMNKPVLDFDEFMSISGCIQADNHTDSAPQIEGPKPLPSAALTMTSVAGKEVYSSGRQEPVVLAPPSVATPAPTPEEEDDVTIPVEPGTPCRHKGCSAIYVSNEINRQENGEGAVCIYHPLPPVFREGSKGYLCCKRRVLEFDEFLKIEGCKTGRHVFVPRIANEVEKMMTCRVDHYQTLSQVHVSVFAKQADKERSAIKFEQTQVVIDLYLPGSKRYFRALDLFGPIDPTNSTYHFFGTKVELRLQKQDTRSWTVLEKTTQDLGNISLTFGVSGRTGTVGAKDLVLDETNKARP